MDNPDLIFTNQSAEQRRAHLNRGYAIALIGVTLWSTTGIFISYLFKHYPLSPMTLAFWRNIFVVISLGLGLLIFRRNFFKIQKRDRWFLLLYGLSLSLMNGLWTFSVAYNGAAVSTVLVYASPGITAIAGKFIFKERLTWIRILAVVASLIGCVLVARATDPEQWTLNAVGISIGVGSAFSFTLYSVMGKIVFHRQINSWGATWYAFVIAMVVFAFTQTGDTVLSLGTHFDGWLILIVLAVIPTLGGFGLYTASLGYLPAGTANLIAVLEPVLTSILAFFLLGETLLPIQLLGAAFIVGSVVSLRLEEQ
ncbi:MAG TPA: DMT family transporter [Anaerolineae bacterium]|nr:DMT family transporter [Anaerolineae bacterium]